MASGSTLAKHGTRSLADKSQAIQVNQRDRLSGAVGDKSWHGWVHK